jgi:hypothetical protein
MYESASWIAKPVAGYLLRSPASSALIAAQSTQAAGTSAPTPAPACGHRSRCFDAMPEP